MSYTISFLNLCFFLGGIAFWLCSIAYERRANQVLDEAQAILGEVQKIAARCEAIDEDPPDGGRSFDDDEEGTTNGFGAFEGTSLEITEGEQMAAQMDSDRPVKDGPLYEFLMEAMNSKDGKGVMRVYDETGKRKPPKT